MNSQSRKVNSTWSRAKSGLRRYLRPGPNQNIWYIHTRIGRKVLSESTGSTSKAIARTKLHERLNQLAKGPALRTGFQENLPLTLGDCVKVFQHRYAASDLDELTKVKRAHCLRTLQNTWQSVPEFRSQGLERFETCRPSDISYDHLLFWRNLFLKPEADGGVGYSADYFNKTLQVLRGIFEVAVEGQQISTNPAARVECATVKNKELIIPTTQELEKILSAPFLSPSARDLLNGLRFSGLRKNEANKLRARHVDLLNWKLRLPAEVCKNGKRSSGRGRDVPIFEEARPLFARLVDQADGPDGCIFQIDSARRQFKKAAEWAELSHLSKIDHHILRHYFATRCLECTKDVQVVAEWLGHSDNGKLVLEVYSHVCEKFSARAATLVKFGDPAATRGFDANVSATLAKLSAEEVQRLLALLRTSPAAVA
jgi:site-specific recombinase XerD